MKTLQQIVNAIQGELALTQTSPVINNADLTTAQILAVLNECGEAIRDYPEMGWNFLKAEANLVVNTPITLTGVLTSNSPIITNIQPNTNNLTAGIMSISSNAVPVSSRIKTVDSTSQVTMTMTYTGTSTATQTILFGQDMYALPSDFKSFVNRTFWDRTNHWELLGPASPQLDQWHKSGIVATGPRRFFRIIGHQPQTMQFWPAFFEIINPVQFAYEYFSNNWVNLLGTGVNTASAFANDTDTPFIDDRILIMLAKAKFQQAKGLAFDTYYNEFLDRIKLLIGRDGAAETLYLTKRHNSIFVSPSQVQDGNYPGAIGPNSS